MILVVDASVALKWFFQNRDDEKDCEPALSILSAVDEGRIQLQRPPHFIAEMAAVLARKKPDECEDDLFDLLNVEFQITQQPEIYSTAIDLATRLPCIRPTQASSPLMKSTIVNRKKMARYCF